MTHAKPSRFTDINMISMAGQRPIQPTSQNEILDQSSVVRDLDLYRQTSSALSKIENAEDETIGFVYENDNQSTVRMSQ